MTDPVLEFTGERFTPECVREIWYEHMHRYAFARPFARGLRVLDAACGEGYGAALLAQVADEVVGLDISEQAIDHARARYGDRANLRFEVADCTALDDWDDAGFDLIASFETLEHVHEQERMLDGFVRLLRPGGVLLVSTPDKHTYTDLTGFTNEYHVRELYRHEFEALLASRFSAFRLFGQKLLFQSALWDVSAPPAAPGWQAAVLDQVNDSVSENLSFAPVYYIAVCSNAPAGLPPLPSLALFGDAQESVYQHYNEEVRRHIAAGLRLQQLEAELERERAARQALEAKLASG